MIFADYQFYQEQYLLGKSPLIPENEFKFYANKASNEILNRIKFDFNGEPIEEMKQAMCELAEVQFSQSNSNSASVPLGVASEKVGEYTVTYKGNSNIQIERDYTLKVTSVLKKWLGKTGYLYRGI